MNISKMLALHELITNDAYAITFQSLPQYRTALRNLLIANKPATTVPEGNALSEQLDAFETTMLKKGYPQEWFNGFHAEGEFNFYERTANCMFDAWQAAQEPAAVPQQAAALNHCDPAEGFCKACRTQERTAQPGGGQEDEK